MDASFFTNNRHALQHLLGGGAVVVLTGYSEMQRTNDEAHDFIQEANFWYLSGINEPAWWLILEGGKSWAVAPTLDAVKQAFDGSLGMTDAKKISGVDKVIDREEALVLMRQMAAQHSMVYTAEQSTVVLKYSSFHPNPAQAELGQLLQRTFKNVDHCNRHLAKLRAIKQDVELAAIQRAIASTVKAMKAIKQKLPALSYEYQVEATLAYEIRNSGADGQAFSPIVATGIEACTIHHNVAKTRLKRPGLLLIDAGARFDGYAADISRTYGLGRPTLRQHAAQQAVVSAQADIITYIEPGRTLEAYQKKVDTRLEQMLAELKLDPKHVYDRYMPHAIGHGLGIDTHDSLGGYDSFQPGMVVTVEPGVYIAAEEIGVRVEDDILVTETGRKVLSKALPNDI